MQNKNQRGDVVDVFTHSMIFTKKPDGEARLLKRHFVASDNWEFWAVKPIEKSDKTDSGKSGLRARPSPGPPIPEVHRWVSPR